MQPLCNRVPGKPSLVGEAAERLKTPVSITVVNPAVVESPLSPLSAIGRCKPAGYFFQIRPRSA
jgi:hypothetical protein